MHVVQGMVIQEFASYMMQVVHCTNGSFIFQEAVTLCFSTCSARPSKNMGPGPIFPGDGPGALSRLWAHVWGKQVVKRTSEERTTLVAKMLLDTCVFEANEAVVHDFGVAV